MPDDPAQVNEEFRIALRNQIAFTARLGLEIAVLQKALLNAKVLTEADIDRAKIEVDREGKQRVAQIGNAIRLDPPEGIQ